MEKVKDSVLKKIKQWKVMEYKWKKERGKQGEKKIQKGERMVVPIGVTHQDRMTPE